MPRERTVELGKAVGAVAPQTRSTSVSLFVAFGAAVAAIARMLSAMRHRTLGPYPP